MTGPTLEERVAMVTDACQVGWVGPDAAVAVLRDVTGLCSGQCLRLFIDEIRSRRGTPPPNYEGWPL